MNFETWLQSRLTAHGLPVVSDGDWGRASIEALKTFQKRMGIPATGIADAATVEALRVDPDEPSQKFIVPEQTMPPWMNEIHRRMGLHEVKDKARLIDFLKIGKFLGDPQNLPWCGDCVESAISKTLPSEPLPANPFYAQAWAKFGVGVSPLVGSVGVIRWSATSGHVGIVAGVEATRIRLLGGNQSNSISIASFALNKFIAFRWPKTFPIKTYPALKGTSTVITNEGNTR